MDKLLLLSLRESMGILRISKVAST
jgi:hypothetical protein